MPRVAKYVINHDQGGTKVVCAWDECDRPGYELYKVRQHEHVPAVACSSPLARHINYIFCTERHRQYWLNCTGEAAHVSAERNRGRIAGMLPAGYKGTIL